jgi:hypothetical protein
MAPKAVALDLVHAAKENNLDRVINSADLPEIYRGPHGREPQDLVKFLRDIDLDEVRIKGGETVSDPPAETESVLLETPDGSMRIDFRLRTTRLVLGDTEYSHHEVPIPPRYEIVEIHQHP